MPFFRYLFRSRSDNIYALCLWICLTLFYLSINLPFLDFMNAHEELLLGRSPFDQVPFTLHLFSFDPGMYDGYSHVSILHPLKSLLSGLLVAISAHGGGNLLFAILQSSMNAACSALVFYYLRRSAKGSLWMALIGAGWFGVSSYSLFTAFIPHSYAYAQLILLVSVLYVHYVRKGSELPVFPLAVFAAANFGVAAINLISFGAAALISSWRRPFKAYALWTARVGAAAALLLIALTLLQAATNGGASWATSWSQGGYSCLGCFELSQHAKFNTMLFISPVLSPAAVSIDSGLSVFAADLARPHPWHVSLIGFSLLAASIAGFIRLRRTREGWMLAVFPLTAVVVYIGAAFGLASFSYVDAGHFLFAVFLLGGRFAIELKTPAARRAVMITAAVFALATLVHNIIMHEQILSVVNAAYEQLDSKSNPSSP